ncbi:G1/S-specific cyclin-D3 [Discoglossus pictus]
MEPLDGEACAKVLRASVDPKLHLDSRVLRNLIAQDKKQLPRSAHCQCHQPEVTLGMRKLLAFWMLEVCEEQSCEEGVFQLAMCLLRNFLSMCPVQTCQLQLLGTVCTLLASKMRDMVPITVEKLCIYTDCSVTACEIRDWELLVLSKLHWDVAAVVSHDFLEHLLVRLPLSCEGRALARRHAQTFIAMCAADCSFSMYTCSMVAAGSIAVAVLGLHLLPRPGPAEDLIEHLATLIDAASEDLRRCQEFISSALSDTLSWAPAPHCEGPCYQKTLVQPKPHNTSLSPCEMGPYA